jgi:hypothetical protein
LSSSAKRLRSEAEVALAWCSRTCSTQCMMVGECKHLHRAALLLLCRGSMRQAHTPCTVDACGRCKHAHSTYLCLRGGVAAGRTLLGRQGYPHPQAIRGGVPGAVLT